MKRRILILSGTQLSVNPRVVKEADTLSDAGYSVEVVGGLFDRNFADRERAIHESKGWDYKKIVDASSDSAGEKLKWFFLRGRRRLAREAHARFGIESSRQLGYLAPEMLDYALERDADLTIVHNAAAVWVGLELIRRGKRVAVDMEDWYSEDLTSEERIHFPGDALRRHEREALRGAAFSTTTSKCMSDAIAEAYQCDPPAVVYNSFPLGDRSLIDGERRDRGESALPSICWFSQVIGPRRGLELLMDSLHMITVPCEVHLRGSVDAKYKQELLARAPESMQDKIVFHSQVPHDALLSRIAEHDIGLAADIPHSRSRALTVTNKILLYLLAGIPIAASDTEGHREVAGQAAEAVFLYSTESAADCANALTRLLADAGLRLLARAKAVEAARQVFSWERSGEVLTSAVESALLAPRGQRRILRDYGS